MNYQNVKRLTFKRNTEEVVLMKTKLVLYLFTYKVKLKKMPFNVGKHNKLIQFVHK